MLRKCTDEDISDEECEKVIDFRKDKVKENTLYGYNNKLPYLKSLYKVKLKDFNYPTFEKWHDEINSYKN